MKGYLVRYASRKTPGEEHIVDVAFDHRLENASAWGTRQDAENECKLLDGLRVTITFGALKRSTVCIEHPDHNH